MSNTPELRAACAQQLLANVRRVRRLRAFLGFDGFVDHIIHVVDKREGPRAFDRIPTIAGLAERVAGAAGRSTNIELVTVRTKLGGNGPIMANALARFGLRVDYVGALGHPHLHPVFKDFARRTGVHSIADAAQTDALEFEDGKLLFGKLTALDEVTWRNIQERYGRRRFQSKFAHADLVGFVNWTMVPHMSEVWDALLQELCPALTPVRRKIFFDLADPEKRTPRDIRRALKLIVRFNDFFDVILGLNEKEAFELAEVLGLKADDHSAEGVSRLALQLSRRLPVETLVVHPVTYALAVSGGQVSLVTGPYVKRPVITTGAGDHFNAGFCLGKLLGFSNELGVLTGVATSGFYVATGRTPAIRDLVGLLRKWPVRHRA